MKKPSAFELKVRFDFPRDVAAKDVVEAVMRAVCTRQFGLVGRCHVSEIRKLKEGSDGEHEGDG